MKIETLIYKKLNDHHSVINKSIKQFILVYDEIINHITGAIDRGNNIYVCGNGGSAADALHFSGEFVSKFKSSKRSPLNFMCLNSNVSAITSIGNDFGYDHIFSRQIQAHGKANDLIFLFSTSGKSKNIIQAARVSKNLKINSILFTGKSKTELHNYCDVIFKANSNKTDIIQETHIFFYHLICDHFENYL